MSDKLKYYNNTFPSPIAPDEVKKTPEYGLAVGKAIWSTAIMGNTSYYSTRNIKFAESRIFANGKQPFQTYLQLMGIDGKNSFTNLDYHPRAIAPKFRDILVNSIMEKVERVDCTGLSLDMKKRKQDKKDDAAFRMKEKEYIQSIQGDSGVQFEDPEAFTPESEEELDIWSRLNDKEREELLMEEGIQFILYNNDWEVIKKDYVGDLVDTGMGFVQNYFDGCNRIRLRRIKPENMIYGSTSTLDFKKPAYMGHIERMSVTDGRAMWPKITEKEWYELAKNNVGLYGNPSDLIDFNPDYTSAYTRPYDGFFVDVLFFEYRVTKYINVVKSVDKNGNKVVEYVKESFRPTAEDKSLSKKPLVTIYAGAYILGSEIMPMWGEQSNLLRNNDDFEDLRYSYAGYMLNNDGTMIPISPIDAMKSSIIQMDLAVLKIQQHLAGAAPDGARIDIDSITEIDLGKGIGKVGPMKLREIRLQTGDEYFSSKDFSGENKLPPISDAIHSMGDKISQFIIVYNFELGCIRDYIGVNEIKDGTGVNPRIGLQVMNNQIQASNTATAHIYGGTVNILNNTAKGCAMRLWDTLKQSDVNSMYVKLLSKKNVDFIKYRKDITSSNYDVMITVDMSQADKDFLEFNINNAIQAATIELEDAIFVRKVPNLDLAIRYLSFMKKKRAKAQQDRELELQTNAQNNQAQIVQQQAAQKAQEQKEMDALEMQKNEAKGVLDHASLVQKLINDSLLKSMDVESKPIPDYVQALIDRQVQEDLKREAMEEQAEMEQQQMAAQEQQQQSPDQVPQEQMAMQ